MIDKIRLFQSMIKYHATIIGWLIKHDKVEKLNDRLVLFTKKAPASQYINTYSREVYLTNSDGSKRIPRSYGNNDIIRKTKRSEKIKRRVSPRKTKRSFFRFPTTQNASGFSGAFCSLLSIHFRHSTESFTFSSPSSNNYRSNGIRM